jgi:Outer membrane protein beta-barrel domain
MKFIVCILVLLSSLIGYGQNKPNFSALDSLYREDQFYLGIAYNNLQNRNNGILQGRFTPSYSAGFLRDMPFNKKRTFAIAAGLGYAINNYNVNFRITQNNNEFNYDILKTAFDKNKLVLHYLDLPLELRWRNSTPESHKFWRIYTGIKASYLVYNYSKFEDFQSSEFIFNNTDLNKFQLGTFLTFGYNTWNFNIYYGLNPIFKNAKINNANLNMKTINFGLMFYIL